MRGGACDAGCDPGFEDDVRSEKVVADLVNYPSIGILVDLLATPA